MNEKSYNTIEGYKNQNPFFEFVAQKYYDVSVAFARQEIANIRKTMREFIDNTYPYHSNKIKVEYQNQDEKKTYSQEVEYWEYFEILVNEHDQAKQMNQHRGEPGKKEIAKATDIFVSESRKLRRNIFRDISRAQIIPQATTKSDREVNEKLKE